jgi:hypothetical protein
MAALPSFHEHGDTQNAPRKAETCNCRSRSQQSRRQTFRRGYATILLRRILFRPWYRLIARIGTTGVDEYFLDPIPLSGTTPQAYRATFTAQRGGELFLYVNDAVIGLPWVNDHYFKNNVGNAKVTVRLM